MQRAGRRRDRLTPNSEDTPISHIVEIKTKLTDLAAVRAACKRLGFTLAEGQTCYRWYGQYVGDTPLPAGVTVADLGKCTHAIRVPRTATSYGYEVGLVGQPDGSFLLRWDYWDGKLTEMLGGTAGGKLLQAYAVEKARLEAQKKGYRVAETTGADGSIKLTVTPRA